MNWASLLALLFLPRLIYYSFQLFPITLRVDIAAQIHFHRKGDTFTATAEEALILSDSL
jgi:hypothetical protein